MRRMHFTLLERERRGEASMALLAGAICGERHDSCLPKQKNARALHQMSSQSLSRGVDLLLAQKFRFFKPKNGPTSGSKQARTDVLLTMVLGPLRRGSGWDQSPWSTTVAAPLRGRLPAPARGNCQGGASLAYFRHNCCMLPRTPFLNRVVWVGSRPPRPAQWTAPSVSRHGPQTTAAAVAGARRYAGGPRRARASTPPTATLPGRLVT